MHKHFEQASVAQTKDVQNIVESLIGSIPNTNLSLNELRQERIEKYEAAPEVLKEGDDSDIVF